MGPLLDREGTIAEFADWMLANKSPENIAFASLIAAQTSSTVMALLSATSAHDDYSEDLKALEGQSPLLYIVRKEWGEVVSDWAASNTPSARVAATMDSHLDFWENPGSFNNELQAFLAGIK